MRKSIGRKTILKEAGVLLVAAILVLTAVFIVPMTTAQKIDHDVGVTDIISPTTGPLQTYPVEVTVKNFGTNAETGVPVEVVIEKDGVPEYDATVFIDIDAGESMNVTFPSWTVTEIGEYQVTACTQLVGDENPSNDCLSVVIYIGEESSNKFAFSGIGNNLQNFAKTSMIDCSTSYGLMMKLWTVYNITAPDTAYVLISTDNVTWTHIIPIGGDIAGSQLEGEYLLFDLSAYEGIPTIWIGFYYQTGPNSKSQGWYVDSIIVFGVSDCNYVETFEEYNVGDYWGDWIIVEKSWPAYVPGEAIVGFYGPLPYFYQDICNEIALKYGITLKDVNDGLCSALYTNVDDDTFNMIMNDPTIKYTERNHFVDPCIAPNDPYWNLYQWGPKHIGAPAAWDLETGSPNLIVALVDTGVDYTHIDLASNIWTDGSGFHGKDWVNHDDNPKDDNGHGTHCAGIIGAVGNNGIGITGMAWTIKIYAEKVFDATGKNGAYWDVAQAIRHACDAGAKIISMSLGGSYNDSNVYEAVKYAYNRGCLLVAASGNDGISTISYPACYDEVIAVGAVDFNNNLALFSSGGSNWGPQQELVAPGGGDLNGNHNMDLFPNEGILSTYPFGNPPYAYAWGTSMACPHVAGVAALVWSRNPDLTRDEVRCILNCTADNLGNPGWDQYYGAGLVNAFEAVSKAGFRFTVDVTPTSQTIMPGGTITFIITVHLIQGSPTMVSLASDSYYPHTSDFTTFTINPSSGTPTQTQDFTATLTIKASDPAWFISNILRIKASYSIGCCPIVHYSNFFTVTNGAPSQDFVWIKTFDTDNGQPPRYGYCWTSPWINSIPFPPMLGGTVNKLTVTVGNRGSSDVQQVKVKAWYHSYPFFVPIMDFNLLDPLAEQTISSIPAGGQTIPPVSWDWVLPIPQYTTHVCVFAQAWRPGAEDFDPSFNIVLNNNIAQKNFAPVYANSPYTTTFALTNPTDRTFFIKFYMKPPNTDWIIDLCNPSIYENGAVVTPVMIPPGEQRDLTLTIFIPPEEEYGLVNISYSIEGYDEIYPDLTNFTFQVYRDQPPSIPDISGPAKGLPNIKYTYKFTSTDPDADGIYYYIDWGDGSNSGWIGPYASGATVSATHKWSEKGIYTIRAKARDIYGAESDWATYKISTPRIISINDLFLRFLQNHPNMFPILRHLMGLY